MSNRWIDRCRCVNITKSEHVIPRQGLGFVDVDSHTPHYVQSFTQVYFPFFLLV